MSGPWSRPSTKANGNSQARSIYRRLYIPLSNFTVHASGGTLLRHVRRDGGLRRRPSRSWNRRSPARVADAAVGLLAADLAEHAAMPHKKLLSLRRQAHQPYPHADGHHGIQWSRPAHPRPRRVREIARLAKEMYEVLWTGPPARQSPPDVARRICPGTVSSAILDFEELADCQRA